MNKNIINYGRKKATKLWKVAVYIRLSKEDGNDVSLSVINQERIIKDYLERAFDDEYRIIDLYIDDGLTGTDQDRPNFQRMLQDMRDKNINCIIVKDLSRAFRNYSDQGHYLEEIFPTYGIRFIALGNPHVDTYENPTSIDGFDVPLTGVMNDRFCQRTSYEIRRTFNNKRSRGEFIGAFAPYGYIKDPNDKNKLLIDKDVEYVIKDIFSMYLKGKSIRKIVNDLIDKGIPCPTEYKKSKGFNYVNPSDRFSPLWTEKTVTSILKNRVYVGDMVQGKQRKISYKVHKQILTPMEEWFIVEDVHEPIIDRESFAKVQELLEKNPRSANGEIHLFSGFMRCADCKKALHRQVSGKYVYFMCRTYKQYGKKVCTKHTVREDELEEAVLAAIQSQIKVAADVEKIIRGMSESPAAKQKLAFAEKQIKAKQAEKEKIHHLKDSLYMDWKSGDVSRADYFRMRDSFDEKIERIEQALRALEKDKETYSDNKLYEHPYFTSFKKYKNITKLDRKILIELIDTIYVYEGKTIKIKFNFEDEFKRIASLVESKV